MQKYGFIDARDVLERASARETAARVAAGALAKLLLRQLGVEIVSHVVRIGAGAAADRPPARRSATSTAVDASRGALLRPRRRGRHGRRDQGGGQGRRLARRRRRGARLRRARSGWAATSTGTASSTACWPRRCMSIQAVKGVEIGDGFEVAGRPGERGPRPHHLGRRGRAATAAQSTRAGGVEGGMSTGELVVARAAMKPLATLNRPDAGHRRHRHQGGDGVVQGAHRRHRRARPWAWWPRPWWRWCWPTRPPASSAATPSTSSSQRRGLRRAAREPRRTGSRPALGRRGAPLNWDATEAFEVGVDGAPTGRPTPGSRSMSGRADDPGPCVLVGHDGGGQDDRGQAAGQRLGRRSSTPTRSSRPQPAAPIAELVRQPTARRPSAPPRPRCWPSCWPATGAVGDRRRRRRGARRRATAAPAARAGATVVWLRAAGRRSWSHRIAADGHPPAARRRPRRRRCAAWRPSATPLYREVADARRRRRPRAPATGRGRAGRSTRRSRRRAGSEPA